MGLKVDELIKDNKELCNSMQFLNSELEVSKSELLSMKKQQNICADKSLADLDCNEVEVGDVTETSICHRYASSTAHRSQTLK